VWAADPIELEIEEADHPTVIVTARTPVGGLRIIAELELAGGVLWVRNAHIQGLQPGALGRAGLNALARKFLEETGAEALVVEGAARTTGARPGRKPPPFRFPG
jgi:hypothetical protein